MATLALAAGFAPMLILGAALLYLRYKMIARTFSKLHTALMLDAKPPDENLLDLHMFWSPIEVEVLIRAVRYQGFLMERAEFTADEANVLDLAITRIALAQYPESPYFHIILASYLGLVKNDIQAAHGMCEKGRKVANNALQRFAFFVLIKRHQQKQASEHSAESGMDLVSYVAAMFHQRCCETSISRELSPSSQASYVEFQNSFKVLIRSHKAVLKANRNFWFSLLHQEVKLQRLVAGLRRIDNLTSRVEQNYRSVLERYPKSVRLLRSYANFLEEVRHNPWDASRYFTEADKLEDRIVEQHRDAVGEGGDMTNQGLADVDESREACILINIQGSILFVNKALCNMFGYRKTDLEGE